MEFVKAYFTEYEKNLLEQEAKRQNLSLSKLIKKQCQSILTPACDSMTSLFQEEDMPTHSCEKFVKVYLSESEYEKLQEAAQEKGWSMSKLIYQHLHEQNTPIEIICQTKDIYELTETISDAYKHLIGTATGLMQRSLITEHDKERILTLGYEIKDALKAFTTQVYRNRNAIRRNVVKHLNREIDKILSSTYQETKET